MEENLNNTGEEIYRVDYKSFRDMYYNNLTFIYLIFFIVFIIISFTLLMPEDNTGDSFEILYTIFAISISPFIAIPLMIKNKITIYEEVISFEYIRGKASFTCFIPYERLKYKITKSKLILQYGKSIFDKKTFKNLTQEELSKIIEVFNNKNVQRIN